MSKKLSYQLRKVWWECGSNEGAQVDTDIVIEGDENCWLSCTDHLWQTNWERKLTKTLPEAQEESWKQRPAARVREKEKKKKKVGSQRMQIPNPASNICTRESLSFTFLTTFLFYKFRWLLEGSGIKMQYFNFVKYQQIMCISLFLSWKYSKYHSFSWKTWTSLALYLSLLKHWTSHPVFLSIRM